MCKVLKYLFNRFPIYLKITKAINNLIIWVAAIIFIILGILYGEDYFIIIFKTYIILILLLSPVTYNLDFKDNLNPKSSLFFCITILVFLLILIIY